MIDGGPAVRRRVMRGAALALSGWLLVACNGGGTPNLESITGPPSSTATDSSSPNSTATASPSASPLFSSTEETATTVSATEAADRAAAEAQWARYWEVYAALPHTPETQWDALLTAVAVEPMITNAKTDARVIIGKGRDTYGTVTHRFSWPKSIEGGVTATLSDCDDTSQSGALETATGNKVTAGVPRRNTVGTLVRGDDGDWRVSAAYILKDEPC